MKVRVFAWTGMALLLAGVGQFEFPSLVTKVGASKAGRTAAGRTPYRQTEDCYAGGLVRCDAYFPPVPAHQRLVVQSVSVKVETNTKLNCVQFYGNAIRDVSFELESGSGQGKKLYAGGQTRMESFSAGEQPSFSVNIEPGSNAFSSASMTLTGYMVEY